MATNQNSIQFIPTTCSSCGGEMMVSSKLEQAICNYCGKTFLVVKDVKGDGPTAMKYIELGLAAKHSGNAIEAYDYFTKALEMDPKDPDAWLGKAVTTFWHSSFPSNEYVERFDEQLASIREAYSYYEKVTLYCPENKRRAYLYSFKIELVCMCGVLADTIHWLGWDFKNIDFFPDHGRRNMLLTADDMVKECDEALDDILGENPQYEKLRLVSPLKNISVMCESIANRLERWSKERQDLVEWFSKFSEASKKYDRLSKNLQ